MVAAYGYIQVSLHTQSSRCILHTLHTQLPLHPHAYKQMQLYAAVCSVNAGRIERSPSPWMRAYASHSCMRHALYADHRRMQPYAAGPCMQSCIRIAFTCIQAPAAFTRIRSRVAYGRLHMHPICIQGRLRAHPRMYASAYECKCYQLDAGVCRQSPLRLLKYPSSIH